MPSSNSSAVSGYENPKEELLLSSTVVEKNLEGEQYLDINVPGDGNCLFYAVTLAVLFPAIKDRDLFVARFQNLFGESVSEEAANELWNLLQAYDGNPHFIRKHDRELSDLVKRIFRPRLVDYMMNEIGPGFISGTDAEVYDYYRQMAKDGTWGDEPEIAAMSKMLFHHIMVYIPEGNQFAKVQADYEPQYPNIIRLIYAGRSHYRYLIKPESFDPRIQLIVSTPTRPVTPPLCAPVENDDQPKVQQPPAQRPTTIPPTTPPRSVDVDAIAAATQNNLRSCTSSLRAHHCLFQAFRSQPLTLEQQERLFQETKCIDILNRHKHSKWDTLFGKNNTPAWSTAITKLRKDAFATLKQEVAALKSDDEKLALLTKARTMAIFNQHRNNYFFTGAFGRTKTVAMIDDLRAEIEKKLHPEQSSCCGFISQLLKRIRGH